MIYDLWYRLSRTIFPFISLKRYHEICDDYDAMLNRQFDCIESQAEMIESLRHEIDASYPLPPLDNFTVSPVDSDYENDVARMDNEGSVNPAQWERDQ